MENKQIYFNQPDTIEFELNENSYGFIISMKRIENPEKTDYIDIDENFFVDLIEYSHGISQRLFYFDECCQDNYPKLTWAGDLDRDGKLDFLYDRSGHYLISDLVLCLSSASEIGDLFKEVANFRYSTGD